MNKLNLLTYFIFINFLFGEKSLLPPITSDWITLQKNPISIEWLDYNGTYWCKASSNISAPLEDIQNKSYMEAFDKDSQKVTIASILDKNIVEPIQDEITQHTSDSESLAASAPSTSALAPVINVKSEKRDQISTGLFHNSQQASVAVFQDGSYGSVGFKRYIKTSCR